MTRTVQLVVLLILGALFGLSALSRRYPQIGWLQAFHIKPPQLSEVQKARMRRRANILAGLKFVLLGFAVPVVYVGSSIMMFNDPSRRGLIISGIVGFGLIVLGLVAIWSNRGESRRRDRDREFYQRMTGRPWDPPGTD